MENMMISEGEILLRLGIAAVLGALVGYERERHSQPAGLRTHIILLIGSTLAMILSINLAAQFRQFVPNGDPARLAAQVISGIGFLGAGAIIHSGTNVRGLTTATSLWSMAVIGLAVGSGYYLVAVAATVLLLVVLIVLDIFEKRFIRSISLLTVRVTADDHPKLISNLKQLFNRREMKINSLNLRKDLEDGTTDLEFVVQVREGISLDELAEDISDLKGVQRIRLG